MAETINAGWLQNYDGSKFAPKTIINELYTPTGLLMCANLDANNNLGNSSQPIYIDNGQFKVCAEGNLRVEFDSGVLATNTYSYAGNKSKFYIVTISEMFNSFSTIIIDCSILATNTSYQFVGVLNDGAGYGETATLCGIQLTLDSNRYPTFSYHETGQYDNALYNIRGYY